MGLHMLFDYTSEDGTTLSAGEPVTVVQADGDGWALVQTANDTMIWAPFDFVSKPAPAPLPDQGDYAHLTLSANPDYRAPAEHAPSEVEYSVLQVSARERLGTVLAMKKHVDALPDNALSMMQEENEDPLYDVVSSVPPSSSSQRQPSVYETIRPSFIQPMPKAAPAAAIPAPLASIPGSVADWLESIGLSQYLDVLNSTPGFETLQGCATIDDDVALNEFCMSDSRDVTALCIAARQLQVALATAATTPPAAATPPSQETTVAPVGKIVLLPATTHARAKAAPPPPPRRTPTIYGTADDIAPQSASTATTSRIVYTSVTIPAATPSGGDCGDQNSATEAPEAQYTHIELKSKHQPALNPVVINIPSPPPPSEGAVGAASQSDSDAHYASPEDNVAPDGGNDGYKVANAVETEALYNVVDNTPDPAPTDATPPGPEAITAQPMYVNDVPVASAPDPEAPPLPASAPPVQEAKRLPPPPPPAAPPMALSGIISNNQDNFYDTTDGDHSYAGDGYDLYDSVDPPDNVVTVDVVYSNVPPRHQSAAERTRAYIKAHPMLAAPTVEEDDDAAEWDDEQGGDDAEVPTAAPAVNGNAVPPLPAAADKPGLVTTPGPTPSGIERGGSARASLAALKSKGAVRSQRARVKDNIESMLMGAAPVMSASPTSSTAATPTRTTPTRTTPTPASTGSKKKPPPVKPRAKKGGKAVKSIEVVKLEQQLLVERRVMEAYKGRKRMPKKGPDAEAFKKAQMIHDDAKGTIAALEEALANAS